VSRQARGSIHIRRLRPKVGADFEAKHTPIFYFQSAEYRAEDTMKHYRAVVGVADADRLLP
jgi:hypothetical protein